MSAYRSASAAGAARALRAPGELTVRVAFYAIILVVFSSLWSVAVEANGGSIEGYTFASMLWYVAAAEGAVIATKPRMIEDIGNEIGTGGIAIEMLRPVSVVGFRMAAEMGEALVRLLAAGFVGALFVGSVVGPPPDLPGALIGLLSAVIGVAVNLAAQHAFAGAAFWLEDAKASWFLYQKIIFLLGGMLLPLELLPEWLSDTARWLPFWAMAYIPARFVAGRGEPGLLLVQVGWLVATGAAAAVVFRSGERRLQVVGG
jgi:ABC-2 type transport system permease protein